MFIGCVESSRLFLESLLKEKFEVVGVLTKMIDKISTVVKEIQPTIMILPYQYDVHSDHALVFHTCFSCTKSFRYPSIKRILVMEILSETDFASPEHGFSPNYFVDISVYLEDKINFIKVYESEIQPPPFPRSIENIRALATVRGSTAGVRYAESFILLKEVF